MGVYPPQGLTNQIRSVHILDETIVSEDIGPDAVGDSEVAAHTSTKITITNKAQLNAQIAYMDSTILGFYSATPVAQPATIVDADGTLADITTKFNALLAKLEVLGLLASA